jgi:hypothetical protein
MSREPTQTYPQANFDHDGHIDEFLQTSAVYLGVYADHVMVSANRAWQPQPAVVSREAHYGKSRHYS